MPRLVELTIKSITPPAGSHGGSLHWFRIDFAKGQGRCLGTTGEAQHLRQLTTDWVERALRNPAEQHGWQWVIGTTSPSPGLMLHHSGAGEAIAIDHDPGGTRL